MYKMSQLILGFDMVDEIETLEFYEVCISELFISQYFIYYLILFLPRPISLSAKHSVHSVLPSCSQAPILWLFSWLCFLKPFKNRLVRILSNLIFFVIYQRNLKWRIHFNILNKLPNNHYGMLSDSTFFFSRNTKIIINIILTKCGLSVRLSVPVAQL